MASRRRWPPPPSGRTIGGCTTSASVCRSPTTRRLVATEKASLVVISVTWPPAALEAEAMAEMLRADGFRVLVGRPGLTTADLVAAVEAG